jgi:glycosyltransferase involved in cell wall biosynthesis
MEFVINGRFLTQRITGVQRYARELVQAFDEILDNDSDFRITVLCPQLATPLPTWRNVKLRQVGRLRGNAWEQTELPWYARSETLFCPGNTAPVISLLRGSPVVVTVHDLSYAYFPDAYRPAFRLWYRYIIPLALRRAKAAITVSESERREILARYPRATARLHAIANGALPASIATEKGSPVLERDEFILYAGSLSSRKNFLRTFEAACRLVRERGYRFVFVGGTSKNLIAPMVKVPNEISSKITFVGPVNDLALMQYYQTAACFLFPSLYEASGLPPLEAMALGCPTVVSDIPALRERCGDAAVYCNPLDIDSIVNAVVTVMQDGRLRSRLSALGPERAAGFTWELCARKTLNVIAGSYQASR